MRRRNILSFTLATTLGVTSLFAANGMATASTLSNLQKQQQENHNKQNSVKSNINTKSSAIDKVKGDQQDVKAEIAKLDQAIAETDQKIKDKQTEIANTQAEIEKLKGEIEELKKRIAERNELLKQRARAIQTQGGSVNYLDVLLGAESFSDFIDRASAVTTLVNADKQIIEEQKRDKADLEEKQASVEKKLADLQSMLQDLNNMKSKFNSQKAQRNELLKELHKQQKSLEAEKLNLQEEQELLKGQDAAFAKAIQLEKGRLAELERQRKAAAAERARQAAAAAAHSSSGGGGSVSESLPAVTSGDFMRPAEGYVSSEFGGRWGEIHYGMDIAKGGSVPVVAAADGVVIRSYLSSSYGNCIFVAHSVNGKQYTTVYAHMSTRLIGTGATVAKGQKIGYMGSTGESTGQHLHFELHEGPWTADKRNAVNPRRYINF
ncbi:murein hydrolase activator EnvC family protein [Falsibacillus pallidus]|uniref:Peptidoglycan hydrolase CwlO-like protein n=1 Tax=Falsibacillus pallidus TaxID=493781 RepID=A0A370GA63_9BACI|nr:peptidoglycan DD-metalloendopeptidase family protein [Falsibacillus pallidus]RDI40090.1 peptidoglycan hydrolase CwlO-like protein [Falsibacillus pallidus]